MEIFIRKILPEDAKAVTVLSKQLGYNLSIAETSEYIKAILSSPDNSAYITSDSDKVVGWIHAFIALRIESNPFIEIGGLVVDEAYRGKGIGKALINKVKDWCAEKNILTLRLRSNTKRTDAHQFYQRFGFTEIKEQKVFEMKLFQASGG